jgi:Xaa-Pro aminopeptidase
LSITETRIATLRKTLNEQSLDAFLVSTHENRLYLSGFDAEDSSFNESSGTLIITEKKLILATDSRFELQGKNQAPLFETLCYKGGLDQEFINLASLCNAKKIGFESSRLSVDDHTKLLKKISDAGSDIQLVPTSGIVEKQRCIKDAEEISRMKAALVIAEQAYKNVISLPLAGMTEKEIAWELEKEMRIRGAQSLSFPSIIASGKNSALPHAVPENRIVKKGEPLLIDWGAMLDSYCSDTTRTIVIGSPDKTFEKLYSVLQEASQKAIEHIKAGASTKAIDNKARSIIDNHGFKDKFGHGLGHGVGLEVHEPPRLSPVADTLLEAGMVVTVEPGIYLPEWGGIRLENMVLVHEDGAEILNRLSLLDYIL